MKKQIRVGVLLYLALCSPGLILAQQLIEAIFQQQVAASDINNLLVLLGDSTKVTYDVQTYKVLYYTPHLDGQIDTASGFMAVPVIGDEAAPFLIYQHGTANSRDEVPSRGSTESILATAAAGLGYITLAPDYIGLGDSRGFHPYLHADSEASCAYNLFMAVLPYLSAQSINLNDQVFITGYSQGGHAAMALHNYMETHPLPDNFTVAAASHMSGPYSVSGEMVRRLTSEAPYAYPGYAIYTLLSYDLVYDLFDDLSQILRTPYVSVAKQFHEEQITVSELHDQLSNILLLETGNTIIKNMFLDSVIIGLNDPDNSILQALQANDTYAWAPVASTRLVYCQGDDQVIYTNATFADSAMNSLGAADLFSVDVLSSADHTSCIIPAARFTLDFFDQFRMVTRTTRIIQHDLKVFPNPARDRITLDGLASSGTMILINALGEEVFLRNLHIGEEIIDLPQLATGTYFLRILTGKGEKSLPIIVSQ